MEIRTQISNIYRAKFFQTVTVLHEHCKQSATVATTQAEIPHHSDQNEKIKALPGVYLLTGLGSRGLCSAPLLGELLASEMNNESLPLDKNIYKRMQIPRQWINYMLKNKPLKD